MKNSKRYDDLKKEVSLLETEKSGIEKELEYQVSEAFIEKEAREKLNLIKPGEKVYVLDPQFEDELEDAFSSQRGAMTGREADKTEDVAGISTGSGFSYHLKTWIKVFN